MKLCLCSTVLWFIVILLTAKAVLGGSEFDDCIGYIACDEKTELEDIATRNSLILCFENYGPKGQGTTLSFSRRFFNDDNLNTFEQVLDRGCADKKTGALALEQFYEEKRSVTTLGTKEEEELDKDFNDCISALQRSCQFLHYTRIHNELAKKMSAL